MPNGDDGEKPNRNQDKIIVYNMSNPLRNVNQIPERPTKTQKEVG